MRRRSKPGGQSAKSLRRKAATSWRRDAPKAVRRGDPSVPDLQARLECQARELIEARELQAATAEVLRVISISPHDIQPVFDAIAENAMWICQGRFSFVSRFDNELLHFGACHGLAPEGFKALQRLYPRPATSEDTAAGRAILHRAVVQIPDVLADPAYGALDLAQIATFRSVVAVPMLRDGDPIGAIAVAHAQVGSFPSSQIALLQTFARQAVIAIENTRLFEAEQQRTRELSESLDQQTATSEVLKVISSSPGELDPVFQTLLENATRLCAAKFGNLYLCEGDAFRTIAMHNVPPAFAEARRRDPLVRPGPETALTRLVNTKKVVHVPDITADQAYIDRSPLFVTAVELGGFRAFLAVPMLKDGRLIGAIVIYRQEVGPFTDKQIALVQNFAAQGVIAIENTRLLNELRQRTDDLSKALEQQTATSEVLKTISSSPGNLEPVFNAMLANATRICEAMFGVLLHFDGETFRFAAEVGTPPAFAELVRQRGPFRPLAGSHLDRVMQTKQVSHTADYAAEGIPSPRQARWCAVHGRRANAQG
jgi:GAF domain-containing protein